MIKTLINTTLLTLLTATPGVVGVSSAYYPETGNTSVLNERLGWYDYGLATANYNGVDMHWDTTNKITHLTFVGYYTIDASKINDFLPTLQTWYLPLGSINENIDTTTNNITSIFKIRAYRGTSSNYYLDQKIFTPFDISMIKEGLPVQLKEWNTNNYGPSETVNLEISIQLKMKQEVFTHDYTNVIGNTAFYTWLLTKIAGDNAYNRGYSEGYKDGYDKGYDSGYYVAIRESGGDDGTVNNVFVLLEKGWDGMANMLAIEVFPNFTIGGLLLIPLLFTIGLFIFKVLT